MANSIDFAYERTVLVVADILRGAELTRVPVAPPSAGRPELDVAVAYAIQRENIDRRK